jgi:hypothetical protein
MQLFCKFKCAVSLGSTEDYTSNPKPTPTALPAFSQRFSSASTGVTAHGAVSLPGFTSSGMAHRASPYSPAPAPAHTPSLNYLSNSPSADSSVGNTALWGNYDTGAGLQQYGVVASANSAASRGRAPSISAAASLTASKYLKIYVSLLRWRNLKVILENCVIRRQTEVALCKCCGRSQIVFNVTEKEQFSYPQTELKWPYISDVEGPK